MARIRILSATLAMAAAVVALAASGVAATAEQLAAAGPKIAVIDGDTIQLDGRVLNLANVDAPEIGQLCKQGERLWTCGLDAARALQKVLAMQREPVVCRTEAERGYPEVATCEAGRDDIAEILLASGLAVAQPGAPSTLSHMQEQAHAAGIGIWSSSFVPPAQWRQGVRLVAERMAETSTSQWDGFPYKIFGRRVLPVPRTHHAGCLVKGRTTEAGGREFATPLDPGYQAMPAERTFCSDEEAAHAGWLHVGQAEPGTTRSLAHR